MCKRSPSSAAVYPRSSTSRGAGPPTTSLEVGGRDVGEPTSWSPGPDGGSESVQEVAHAVVERVPGHRDGQPEEAERPERHVAVAHLVVIPGLGGRAERRDVEVVELAAAAGHGAERADDL